MKSVPARFGVPAAILGARVCHTITTALFAWYAVATDAGVFFWLGLTDRRGRVPLRAHHRPPHLT
ncbi:4-hydroxybenzoate octaprenyltransferase OS=Streptomyces tendae OX=1932 GN=GUR47_18190 PE=3 SV=1 [Streptomyces tendae]